MSVNHQYPWLSDGVVARYKKEVTCMVAGKRLNPTKPEEQIDFVLESKFRNFDVVTRTLQFDYSSDVLELYSDHEVRFFESMNKRMFEEGLISQYLDTPDTNASLVNDNDVLKLATLPLIDLQEQVKQMNVNLARRVLRTIETLERPNSYVTLVSDRIKELEESQ